MASQQAAYQALLKLRAREHNVVRGSQQRGGSEGGSSGRAQQQLQQLELQDDENRYETQRQAEAPENESQRETRQVLNRLRELARRQNDLNERMKQLQSALEEAQTAQQQDEIQRQLQRLRDQQQQMLRNTDELQARMDQPQNQQRMADARDQLGQTRENVRRASESLRQGMVSNAAAAGTRAERQLSQLRDEFRRQASGQFDQQVTEMRDQARKLDENQQEVARHLAELADGPRSAAEKSLRNSGDRDQVAEDLEQQKQQLSQLLDRMRQTVVEAEQAEPLLANQLYDTLAPDPTATTGQGPGNNPAGRPRRTDSRRRETRGHRQRRDPPAARGHRGRRPERVGR